MGAGYGYYSKHVPKGYRQCVTKGYGRPILCPKSSQKTMIEKQVLIHTRILQVPIV